MSFLYGNLNDVIRKYGASLPPIDLGTIEAVELTDDEEEEFTLAGNDYLQAYQWGIDTGLLKQAKNGHYVVGALKDLSISRTTFDWGIKVPGNPKHVVYVWLDALANYITAIGYGAEDRTDLSPQQQEIESKKFKTFWPADIHLVGKEITRFHCVYWPAFLMAAGLPIRRSRSAANGWLLLRRIEDVQVARQRRAHRDDSGCLRRSLPRLHRRPQPQTRGRTEKRRHSQGSIRATTKKRCHPERSAERGVEGPRRVWHHHDGSNRSASAAHHHARALQARLRPLRRRCPPLLPAARDSLRPGRQLLLRRPHHALQRRPRQRLRQPRLPHTLDDREVLRRPFTRHSGTIGAIER